MRKHNLQGYYRGETWFSGLRDPHRARKNLSETVAKPKSSNGGRISLPSVQGMEKLPVEFLPGKKAEQTTFKPAIPKAEPIKRKTHGIEKREARKMKTEVYRESGRCFWSIFDSSIM